MVPAQPQNKALAAARMRAAKAQKAAERKAQKLKRSCSEMHSILQNVAAISPAVAAAGVSTSIKGSGARAYTTQSLCVCAPDGFRRHRRV